MNSQKGRAYLLTANPLCFLFCPGTKCVKTVSTQVQQPIWECKAFLFIHVDLWHDWNPSWKHNLKYIESIHKKKGNNVWTFHCLTSFVWLDSDIQLDFPVELSVLPKHDWLKQILLIKDTGRDWNYCQSHWQKKTSSCFIMDRCYLLWIDVQMSNHLS